MKKILGLDLGTNSIGWALVDLDFDQKSGKINGLGSRIIPMSQDVLGKFDSGISISQTAERTAYRGVRRLYQKDNLRRERLHRVLQILGFLPPHYAEDIDFEDRPGQFKTGHEPKLNYIPNDQKKYEFIFKNSFQEMVDEFESLGQNVKIPYDWTLYYLRKKALTEKISKEELAWVILNFNQKRGYYQLRGEDEEKDSNKNEEYFALAVVDVQTTDDTNSKGTWYNVILENNWVYRRQSKESLDNWIGKTREFIITTTIDKDGKEELDKEGNIKRSFRAVDSEKDWIAIKKKTEQDIELSQKHVGQYIYENLLASPKQKIRGKLVKTIERKFYKEELREILTTQKRYHHELQDKYLYLACVNELYPRNEAHQNNIKDKDFVHLLLEDIIFYQRPLKSKKSTISDCPYESKAYLKTVESEENGKSSSKIVKVLEPRKAISKSNPLFQEFRLWQFLHNLKIYQKEGKVKLDEDVTAQLLPEEKNWTSLFDFLNTKKEIEQKQLIEYFVKIGIVPKREKTNYRWNYVEDKKYPCNETHAQFVSRLSKVEGLDVEAFLTPEMEQKLWHIIYSVKDKKQYETTIKNFKLNDKVNSEAFYDNFKKFPPFKNEYGAYSLMAIKKLLPLMRLGKYWDESHMHPGTSERIDKLLSGEYDESIRNRVREKAIKLNAVEDFRGLPTWLACYVVYDRHSELGDITRWETPHDIDKFLKDFKQHSLRNPIVEQVVTETLRVVRDIWSHYGNGAKDFFHEIHIELGREMKNPADRRKAMTAKISENENTNHRIKQILKELMQDSEVVGDVRPYSPSHQEILKIYEEGITQNPNVKYNGFSEEEVDKIRKNGTPSKTEIARYKLWLGQGYVSPYTGETIPLTRLFTTDYQIEHIIPQSRYFDDSLTNKIICESEVNQIKGNQTAYEFIKDKKGMIVELPQGRTVKLFSIETYEDHCRKYFKSNRVKLKKLLSDEIPESFIERQMNDSRYISKLVKGLLSNIVREEGEQEATSKHVVPVTGAITSMLKNDWGLNDKWNEIIAPRFKRMNEITKSNSFGYWDAKINAFRLTVPDELSRGFKKKRIDHRHHALDALVIACTTRDHTNYITSLNTERDNYGLIAKLRVVDEGTFKDKRTGKIKEYKKPKDYHKPWAGFPVEAKQALLSTIVSFKQNLRVINKTNNKTWQWIMEDNAYKKRQVKQTKGNNWAIRKSMHKETVSGQVTVRIRKTVSFANGLKDWEKLVDKKLKSIIRKLISKGIDAKGIAKHFKEKPYEPDGQKIKNLEVYTYTKEATATRTLLTEKFTRKQLDNVTDSNIKNILNRHVARFIEEKSDGKSVERFDLAFGTEGLEELNKNIIELNKGKFHHPVRKVRIYEEGSKFNVGNSGNKDSKYVEAAKGTNLFFAIYWNEAKQKREYETIPLIEVIAHQKWRAVLPKEKRKDTPMIPIRPEKGTFLFSLSPNDLVYVPTEEELKNPHLIDHLKFGEDQTKRIYKMVSSSLSQCFFMQNSVAQVIQNKLEFSALNKMEKTSDNIMIKVRCWKVEFNRLGYIKKILKY